MIIDAHQHFWALDRGDYSFPAPGDAVLYRDFSPADLEPLLAAENVAGTISVQATDSLAETEYLLDLARQTRFVLGVVGWCDLSVAGAVANMDALRARGPLVGLRPMLQRADDASWLLSGPARANIVAMAERNLVFEALVDVRQLAVIDALAHTAPELTIVIDHMAKPWRQPDRWAEWETGLSALARRANCAVKISGYPFGADSTFGSTYPTLIAQLGDWFGWERLIWGSDWPVQLRTTSYRDALDAAREAIPQSQHSGVFAQNAIRTFGLAEPR